MESWLWIIQGNLKSLEILYAWCFQGNKYLQCKKKKKKKDGGGGRKASKQTKNSPQMYPWNGFPNVNLLQANSQDCSPMKIFEIMYIGGTFIKNFN